MQRQCAESSDFSGSAFYVSRAHQQQLAAEESIVSLDARVADVAAAVAEAIVNVESLRGRIAQRREKSANIERGLEEARADIEKMERDLAEGKAAEQRLNAAVVEAHQAVVDQKPLESARDFILRRLTPPPDSPQGVGPALCSYNLRGCQW